MVRLSSMYVLPRYSYLNHETPDQEPAAIDLLRLRYPILHLIVVIQATFLSARDMRGRDRGDRAGPIRITGD